jgi:hypothetical protein
MSTFLSTLVPFCSPARFIDAFDSGTIGDLMAPIGGSRARVTEADLTNGFYFGPVPQIQARPNPMTGTLIAATYAYVVTAVNSFGESLPGPEVSVSATGTTNAVDLQWTAVTGATSYNVYGRTAGQEQFLANTSSTSYTDAGPANTTVAVASNNAVLPQTTINVASTTGFPATGAALVTSSTGTYFVTYTGTTGTTLTGCFGGAGTLSTGGAVQSAPYKPYPGQANSGNPWNPAATIGIGAAFAPPPAATASTSFNVASAYLQPPVTFTSGSASFLRLTRLLLAESGRIESACEKGQMYAASDLQQLTGGAAEMLADMNGGLVMFRLWDRRPPRLREMTLPVSAELALETLEQLRLGQKVFGIVEVQAAGNQTDPYVMTPSDWWARYDVSTAARRYFGNRSRWQAAFYAGGVSVPQIAPGFPQGSTDAVSGD